MILFFNVLVTDVRASAGGMNRVDRLDLFKYALTSYSCITSITRAIIFCELGGSYKSRERKLIDYLGTIFPNTPVEYYAESPSNQVEWKIVLDNSPLLTTSEPILYMGNDDHIFIDSDLDVLNEGLALFANEPLDQINTIVISSWTEAISTIYGLNDFQQVGRYWKTEMLYPDACQIVNSTFFKHVFFDLDMGNDYMRRTDNFLTNWYPTLGDYRYPSKAAHPKVCMFVPLREQVRHFDAYWHIGVPFEYCPKLEIPKGFFEGEIHINQQRGIAPLFWMDRIQNVDYPCYDLESCLKTVNETHRRAMIAPHNRMYQNPSARTPARKENKWRDLGNGELPLEQKYIEAGYYA